MDTERLARDIEEVLERPGITLIKTSSKDYQQVNLALLDVLIEDHGLPGVYVTVNKPYDTIKTLLEEQGTDTSGVFFIDAISKDLNAQEAHDQDTVIFADSPSELTSLSIIMDETVNRLPEGEKFIFFDSMSMLSIHNDDKTVEQFAHSFTNKMREWNVAGLLMSVEEELNSELVAILTQFADHVIEI